MVLRINPEKKEEKERIALALLRATLHLAAAHGFASLGLREVSREAGIAPTSFYRHFADMEELGLSLIDSLVKPFLSGWVDRARATSSGMESIALEALSGAAEDPELMRFILTERVGSIASFRTALHRDLGVVVAGFQEAFAREIGERADVPAKVGEAATVLVLEACARSLDDRAQEPAVRELVLYQLRTLLRGAAATGRQP